MQLTSTQVKLIANRKRTTHEQFVVSPQPNSYRVPNAPCPAVKRFQFESLFSSVAEQSQANQQATTGGFLMTNRNVFNKVVDRVMSVDTETLLSLAKKMQEGERVKSETDEEKTCFDLINDLDHVSYSINGSATSKKHMKNKIWATISYLGCTILVHYICTCRQ